jgi:hypothetical protein
LSDNEREVWRKDGGGKCKEMLEVTAHAMYGHMMEQ